MKKIVLFFLLLAVLVFSDGVYSISDSKIQGRLNIVNGDATECVMHKFYTDTGWIQIEGEIGRNGIDGLYYKTKNGQIKDVLVAESKWNTSKLSRSGKNKLVRQMSQEWVLRTIYKLERHNHSPKYNTIKQFIEHGQYRARLFKILPLGNDRIQINIYKIKNKGRSSFETFVESKLRPINLVKPRNSFEKDMVNVYNNCRKEALNRYFPMLKNSDIDILLKGNYLKKKDIRNFL